MATPYSYPPSLGCCVIYSIRKRMFHAVPPDNIAFGGVGSTVITIIFDTPDGW